MKREELKIRLDDVCFMVVNINLSGSLIDFLVLIVGTVDEENWMVGEGSDITESVGCIDAVLDGGLVEELVGDD